jgi:hypothetical protein
MGSQWYGVNAKWVVGVWSECEMGCGGMVEIGPNIEFFFRKINITTKHKSDHQFENIVVRILGVKQFQSGGAVDHGFGYWNARGTNGHRWMAIKQGAP